MKWKKTMLIMLNITIFIALFLIQKLFQLDSLVPTNTCILYWTLLLSLGIAILVGFIRLHRSLGEKDIDIFELYKTTLTEKADIKVLKEYFIYPISIGGLIMGLLSLAKIAKFDIIYFAANFLAFVQMALILFTLQFLLASLQKNSMV